MLMMAASMLHQGNMKRWEIFHPVIVTVWVTPTNAGSIVWEGIHSQRQRLYLKVLDENERY